MSFGGNNTNSIPIPAQEPLGFNPNNTPTNRQARSIPYFAGVRRLGPTYISQAFDVTADPVFQEIEKGDAILSGYNYYWSWASAYSLGVVDSITKILVEEVAAWEGTLNRSGDSQTITVPERGLVHVHWGTETQATNAILAGLASPNENGVVELHPPYRGIFYLVFQEWFQGYQRSQNVSVEIVAHRHPVIPGLLSDPDVQGDANVPHCILEILTSADYGAGYSLSDFNLTSFDDAASVLSGECLGISPLITRPQSMQQILKDWLQYIRGGLYSDGNGKIAMKLLRSVTRGSGIPTLNESKLSDAPELSCSDFLETTNQTTITFTDRDLDFKESAVTRIDQGNFQITGTGRKQILDRSAITRRSMASFVAAGESRLAAIPPATGSLRLPWAILKSDALDVGGVFKLAWSHLSVEFVYCRITSIKEPGVGEVNAELTFEVDHAEALEVVVQPSAETPPVKILQTPEPAPDATLMEGFFDPDAGDFSDDVIVLATRPNAVTTSMVINRKRPSGSYSDASVAKGFARKGVLDEFYDPEAIVDSTGFLITLSGVDSSLDTTLTLDDATEGSWLAFIDDEILSIYNPTLITGTQYRVKALRQRLGTDRQAHAQGDEVWIVPRAGLARYREKTTHAKTVSYKVQPAIGRNTPALSAVPTLSVTYTGRKRKPLKPLNFTASGGFTYRTGESITLSWSLSTLRPGGFYDAWPDGFDDGLSVELEFYHPTLDLLIQTKMISKEIESYVYSNAELLTDFGAESNIRVRARQSRDGRKSDWTDLITIQKV